MTAPLGQMAPNSALRRFNPLAGISVMLVVAVVLFVSWDLVSGGLVLLAEVPLAVAAGLTAREWWQRGWPMAIALVLVVITNLLYSGLDGGAVLLDVGPVRITTDALLGALAIAVRLLAIAVPAVVFFAILDPTDLSDALVTHWHAPARIAVGSLAAIRMMPLVLADWRQIRMARRTRGIAAGGNPVRGIALVATSLVALLVTSVRRATRLAVAMDSRGFDSGRPRSLARESVWASRDTWLVGTAVVVCGVAVALSISVGTWRTIFG